MHTNLTEFTPSAGKKYFMVFELDTDFGPTSFQIDLNRLKDVTSEDFSTSYMDPKHMLNVLRIPLGELSSIEMFRRSGLIMELKNDGVFLRKHNEPSNAIFLRSQNLREYAFKTIRKILTGNDSIVIDFNFINTYVQIMKKLKIAEFALFMDNMIKYSNGVKLHFIANCDNLLIIFGRKCNYDLNMEAEFIALQNSEHVSQQNEQRQYVSQQSGSNYHDYSQSKHKGDEKMIGEFKAQRVKCSPHNSNAIYVAKDQIKDFKLQTSNKKMMVESNEQSLKEENRAIVAEPVARKGFAFFKTMQEKSMSNTFNNDERNQDYGFGIRQLRCNK